MYNFIPLATALGPSAGAVVVVVLFLRHLQAQTRRHDDMIQNHLSQTREEHKEQVAALQAVNLALHELVAHIKGKLD